MSIRAVAKQGRLVAIVSQLTLIALSVVAFSYSVAGWQLLPNLVLVGVLMSSVRFPASFAVAFTAALFQLPGIPFDHGLQPVYLFMWGLTLVGLSLEIIGKSDNSKPIGKAPWSAVIYGRWGVRAVLLLVVVLTCSLFAGIDWRGGVAPDSDFASRRAWGERVFGPYLTRIDDWVAQAELLRHDVGIIQGIAPTGSPNRYHPAFTDGQYATMNLEVIGTKGKGELYLPYVVISSTGQLRSVGDEARWRFGGEDHLIAKSGKSYLAEHGLEEKYLELLELAEKGAAEEFVDRWYEFEKTLAATSLRSGGSRTGKPRLMPVLHDHYREPLLIHFGAALADLDRNDESAVAYRQAADMNLWRAEDLLEEEDDRRELPRVTEELRRANELLRLANELAPDHEATLKLARERVIFQYLHSIDGRMRPVYSENGKNDQPWARKCLGAFYREAEAYARRSPYIEQTLGGVRTIRIAPRAYSELEVNKHNVYEAAVFLEVVGRNGRGILLVSIRENHRRCTAIDLFSDNPRSPDYPLTIRYPSWTPDGGEEVKLSAKTGEYRRKSADCCR